MSANAQHFVIYGLSMTIESMQEKGSDIWENWSNEKYLPYIEGRPGIPHSLVLDGMSKKYCAFGLRLALADNEGFDFVEIPEFDRPTQQAILEEKFLEIFGFPMPEPPKLLIFTNWS